MKKLLFTSSLIVLALAGCNNVDTALRIHRIVTSSSETKCEFSPENDTQLSVQFDTSGNHLFTLPLVVENLLIEGEIELSKEPPETFTYPNQITPLSFDLRWHCEGNGFGNDLGPMYLPQFSVSAPFCLDERADPDGQFRGFDVVPAAGGTIKPTTEDIVDIRPITPQLAQALDDLFTLAVQAESCCRQAGSCQAVTEQLPSSFASGTACANLVESFDAIAPGQLSTTKIEHIQRFRPFAIFDGNFFTANISANTGTYGRTPGYAMRMRVALEGVTGDGASVTSSEFSDIVTVCRDCGGSTACADR
ncbi:MAG: hypothetical protein IPK13_23730 [Deltaproteobacteria bacterium]|nr:hypothetical protein [Deltaproteobacteria bacterium]